MADKTRVLVVDDIAETRENIRKLLQFEPDIEVIAMARTGREGVQLAKEHRPNVVLMDINMPDMDGIQATSQIVRDVPTAQIVMVSVQSDTDYLRRAMLAGARDFLPKPPSIDELVNTIRRLGDMSREAERKFTAPVMDPGQPARKASLGPDLDGKVITVFSPRGGAGCTTIATNLGIALHSDQSKTLLLDANLQFADMGIFFNFKDKDLRSKGLVNMISRLDEDLDEAFIQSVVATHASGVKVLTGPASPEDAELVNAGHLKRLIDVLRSHFSYIVVDTASVLRDVELTLLDIADRIVLVATPDIPSLASVKKFLDLAEKLEYPKNKILLALNRMDKRIGITPQGIEENIKHSVKVQILYDDRAVINSINSGVPLVTGPKGVPPVAGLLELAQKMKEEFAPKEQAADKKAPTPAPTKPKSLFDRR